MMRIRELVKSVKFWCCVIALPFLLIGCASLYVSMQPGFEGDAHALRRTVATRAGQLYQLSYLEGGAAMGQRVILVHGTPGDASAWYGFMKRAPEGFQMLAIDRPGFGATRPDDALISLRDQAAVLAPLVNAPGRTKPILVGHSLGGPIVAEAAAMYGDHIAGIVIVAGSLDPDLEEVMFLQHVGDTPPFSWLLARDLRNANVELIGLEAELRALRPHLKDIHVPVVIIHGTQDDLVPYANTAYMLREMTGTKPKLVTLEGYNHFLPWNAEDAIMAAIREIAENTRPANIQDSAR